jgi:Rrf2 family transcriptional regulator, cysteine metabolism repressor
MRFPTIFRYGVRAMVQLAATHSDRAVSVRDIGEKQAISAKYLEQILRALKARGLVQAVRGKQGGYVLARPPATITLKDLYESVIGVLAPTHCAPRPDACPLHDICPIWDTFTEVDDAIGTVLGRTTVQDLLTRIERKSAVRDSKCRARVSSPTGPRAGR